MPRVMNEVTADHDVATALDDFTDRPIDGTEPQFQRDADLAAGFLLFDPQPVLAYIAKAQGTNCLLYTSPSPRD